jgi:hypothetical protein
MNKGQSPFVWILVVLAVLFVAGVFTLPTGTQPGAVTAVCGNGRCEIGENQQNCASDCGGTPSAGVCAVDVSPDIDINAFDIDNVGTAFTETNNIYRKVGEVSWSTWTQGTEITDLEFGATYEFVAGISTSDWTDNAYGPHFFWTVPCKPDTQMQISLYDDDVETDLTCTFYNEDDNAAAQAFSAGQTKTVSWKIYAAAEDYFGNPYIASDPTMSDKGEHRRKYPNCLNLNLNSTAWDAPVKVYFQTMDGLGDELNRIPCPGIADGNSTTISYCYECPVITDTITRVYAKLDADDTTANDPVYDDQLYVYAGNYFTTDEGALDWGCETDLLSYVGTDDADLCSVDVS